MTVFVEARTEPWKIAITAEEQNERVYMISIGAAYDCLSVMTGLRMIDM